MGRKSAKGKERKAKRKENAELVNQYWTIVAEANKQVDPMSSLVSFKSYKLEKSNVSISFCKYEDLDKTTLKWAFDLAKKNMETLYEESGWGWKDTQKLKEMSDDNARYLIAKDESGTPIGFVNFRFDLDFDLPVLYCYEIQLECQVQRKGLGFFLMQILQLIAIKNGLHKVMATVLKNNVKSLEFFLTKLKFIEDETSLEDECYIIVSKAAKINK